MLDDPKEFLRTFAVPYPLIVRVEGEFSQQEAEELAQAVKNWQVNGHGFIMPDRVEIFVFCDGEFIGMPPAAGSRLAAQPVTPPTRPSLIRRFISWLFGTTPR